MRVRARAVEGNAVDIGITVNAQCASARIRPSYNRAPLFTAREDEIGAALARMQIMRL